MRKGFTLIELLAVIVILAIIALIATPIVLKIINNTKESSIQRSLELYQESISNAVARYQLKTGHTLSGEYATTEDGKKLYLRSDATKTPVSCLTIEYNGNRVICGEVNIGSNGKISYSNCKVNNALVENVAELQPTETPTQTPTEPPVQTPTYISFSADSWANIAKIIRDGKASEAYKIGDTKEVDLGATYGKHIVRIANMSKPAECSNIGYSQTTCGFVVEFGDAIVLHNMNPTGTYKSVSYGVGWNKDGYPASSMYTFLKNDIYNALPTDLKNVIIDTTVISSHGSLDTTNYTTIDKLYLLSPKEIWNGNTDYDTAASTTRQLDYYKEIGVTTSSFAGAIKKYNGVEKPWWLRTACSNSNILFYNARFSGDWRNSNANDASGVAPAFRIG